MKKIIFIGLILSLFFSCKKSINDPIPFSGDEFNFAIDTSYSLIDLFQYKAYEDCAFTPYWENKYLKIHGYIDTVPQRFPRYQLIDRFPNFGTQTFSLPIADSDSANIFKKIKDNPLRQCEIKMACKTINNGSNNCVKILTFSVEKADDIELK